jgi:hypothetical protein
MRGCWRQLLYVRIVRFSVVRKRGVCIVSLDAYQSCGITTLMQVIVGTSTLGYAMGHDGLDFSWGLCAA